VNNRSLSRGDAVVIGAAVLLFIFSFLDLYEVSYEGMSDSVNAWESDYFPVLPTVYLNGVIAAGLIVGSRFMAQREKPIAGLRLDQWGTALAVTPVWAAIWTLIGGPEGLDKGVGLILGFFAAALLAFGAIASPLIPALKAPLSSSTPGQPAGMGQPYGGQQQGYGYPGAGAAQPQPGQPYGAQPQQNVAAAPGQPQGGADPNFQPFWFAVPAARPLYGEDGSPTPVAELAPGTWYLAVEQRGQALVAQTQDGRRGVLQDTSGIQRG
jgi:hypothetical protein